MKRLGTSGLFFALAVLVVLGLVLGSVLVAREAWSELAILTAALVSGIVGCVYVRYQSRAIRKDLATLRGMAQDASLQLGRLERRVTTIDNIAGSIGRAAPVIRAIDSNVRSLLRASDLEVASEAPIVAAPLAPLPPAESSAKEPTFRDLRVLMVADEFTVQSFASEWRIELPTPDDWPEYLAQDLPDLLFVESAWHGNNGAWLYHLVGTSAPRPAIVGLVSACRERGIPTLFWNKEDPPHFEDFLETARLFDWVATTDGDLLDDYRERLGHDRVFLLPFAAQHRLHNPVRHAEGQKRVRNVVFGGMYFRHKYPERRQQMETLLPAASKLGLDIYTRHADKPEYAYPPDLQPHVRGSLAYPQMVSAYKAYKVVINVNSVIGSSTMCARRIFEATACGAAVVTMETPALRHYFDEDHLTAVGDEQEAFDAMRLMIRSDETRERQVHAAQRRVWAEHTYSHRAAAVMDRLGFEVPSDWQDPPVSVICSTNRPSNFRSVLEAYARQTYPNKQLLVATHGFEVGHEQLRRMMDELELTDAPELLPAGEDNSLGDNLTQLVSASAGQHVVRMDDDDFYGPHYVSDSLYAQRYSGADLVGKEASYLYFESLDSTYLTFPHREHCWTEFVRGATFSGPRETFERVGFASRNRGEDSDFLTRLRVEGGRIYAADRFNFVAHRSADKGLHTWSASDRHLASTGLMKVVGQGRDFVSV